MRVERLASADSAGGQRWDRFVDSCADGSFFHRVGWQSVIHDSFGHATHYLQALDAQDGLRGVLPLAHVKSRLFGSSLVSLPFASFGGIAADHDQARDALQSAAVALAQRLDVAHLELRNVKRQQSDWPTQDLYVAFRMPIPPVLDDKMLAIPQKRRNMVRKAIKLGLHAVRDDTVANFFPAFAINARDHGTPTLPRSWFERIARAFGDDCRILSVRNAEGLTVSSIMCFWHKGVVMAHYAGERPEARGTAANDLKYWELMRWARDRGFGVFDIGRSKKGTGSYEFKRLWGFEPVQLHYQYHLLKRDGIPQNNPNNPKYKRVIRAWQRLPMPVANLIGPWLVRSLG